MEFTEDGSPTCGRPLLKRLHGCFRGGRLRGVEGMGVAGLSDNIGGPWPVGHPLPYAYGKAIFLQDTASLLLNLLSLNLKTKEVGPRGRRPSWPTSRGVKLLCRLNHDNPRGPFMDSPCSSRDPLSQCQCHCGLDLTIQMRGQTSLAPQT
jgi:hypothetical protein